MKKYVGILFIVILLLESCQTPNYLPKPMNLKYYTKGLWIECNIKNAPQINGELIAVENNKLYVLPSNNSIIKVNKQQISSATLNISLTTNSPEKLSAAPLIPILSISHGLFLAFTLPINLAIVIPTFATHKSGSYVVKYPEGATWEEMARFSRFPQGIPEGVDFNYIKSPGYTSN